MGASSSSQTYSIPKIVDTPENGDTVWSIATSLQTTIGTPTVKRVPQNRICIFHLANQEPSSIERIFSYSPQGLATYLENKGFR